MKKSLVALVGLASATGFAQSTYSFDFHEIASSLPFVMQSVNDQGDVFGYLHHSNGANDFVVYNMSTGFQNLPLIQTDGAIGKFTLGGNIYTRTVDGSGQMVETSSIFRSSVGGSKTLVDLTNSGALSLGSTIRNTIVSDDDRILFTAGTSTYVWSSSLGTALVGNGMSPLSFGLNGSVIVTTGGGALQRIASNGTITPITAPSGTAQYGELNGYTELPGGTKQYSFYKATSNGSTFTSVFTEYIVPAGGEPAYAVARNTSQQGIFTSAGGHNVVGLNENGFAPTSTWNFTNDLFMDSEVFGITRADNSSANSFIRNAIGSSHYVIGTAPGLGNVIGSYTGSPNPVPEPASFAAVGLGLCVMIRRRQKSA